MAGTKSNSKAIPKTKAKSKDAFIRSLDNSEVGASFCMPVIGSSSGPGQLNERMAEAGER
jgi:hypothetical protein